MFLDNGNIRLSTDPHNNLLPHKGKHYSIDFLKEENKYIQGGNGIVFLLSDEEEGVEYVIKFCKFKESLRSDRKISKRILRFDREIEALYRARENEIQAIVQINFDGYHFIDGEEFGYYVMEKCDYTLNTYLKENELDLTQRVILCQKILVGIKSLNDYKIYHRDIKHDNIFFINGEPIIGDLGLADFRGSDIYINERGELIGPTGWFSPEAINKYLLENTSNPYHLDIKIDEMSEIFQLGKLFWYIFQGNLPIGQISLEDFIPRDRDIFNIIHNMLSYNKGNRAKSSEILSSLDRLLEIKD